MSKNLISINLGGWLVLEKWITPSVFAGTIAKDEYSLAKKLDSVDVKKRLNKHRENFIIEADFDWMAKNHIKLLRIPVGYWIFGGEEPYVSGIKYLDFAFAQAEKHDIKILICMHGAAGSQNGKQHSGRAGKIGWLTPKNQKKTLNCLEALANRYKDSVSLWGFEPLNEPDPKITKIHLTKFYKEAYTRIRANCDEKIKFVISDQFKVFRWINGLGRGYKNVLLDRHFYQIFSDIDNKSSYSTKIFIVKVYWRFLIWLSQIFMPMIVGEWSAALPKHGPDNNYRYLKSQQKVFKKARADFYWTYKTEQSGKWSYRLLETRQNLL